ncbi:unnamed protein product, partial [Mesorhabditis belari]|uniref:INO80 complex subunit E n=1 Tax=Mesorhabditis belari TaxID=2138241 RepID=A0AAF3JC38_9BILA
MDPRMIIDEKPQTSSTFDPYVIKYEALKAKYSYIQESNNLLRNRLYHVKKEIVYLERLKRVLCNKLLASNDEFFVAQLEIPDDEGGSSEEQMKKRMVPLIQSITQQENRSKEVGHPSPARPPRKRKPPPMNHGNTQMQSFPLSIPISSTPTSASSSVPQSPLAASCSTPPILFNSDPQ